MVEFPLTRHPRLLRFELGKEDLIGKDDLDVGGWLGNEDLIGKDDLDVGGWLGKVDLIGKDDLDVGCWLGVSYVGWAARR